MSKIGRIDRLAKSRTGQAESSAEGKRWTCQQSASYP